MNTYTSDYSAYMKSDAWREKKNARFRIDRGRCQYCMREIQPGERWTCHHLDYSHLGWENILTDLITVHQSCHEIIHGLDPEHQKLIAEQKAHEAEAFQENENRRQESEHIQTKRTEWFQNFIEYAEPFEISNGGTYNLSNTQDVRALMVQYIAEEPTSHAFPVCSNDIPYDFVTCFPGSSSIVFHFNEIHKATIKKLKSEGITKVADLIKRTGYSRNQVNKFLFCEGGNN